MPRATERLLGGARARYLLWFGQDQRDRPDGGPAAEAPARIFAASLVTTASTANAVGDCATCCSPAGVWYIDGGPETALRAAALVPFGDPIAPSFVTLSGVSVSESALSGIRIGTGFFSGACTRQRMNSFVGGDVGASQAPIGLQVILHSRVSFFWPKLLFLVSARIRGPPGP